jgi:hypothetical protein
MNRHVPIAALLSLAFMLIAGSPTSAATSYTLISHGDTGTEYYGEDICGARRAG